MNLLSEAISFAAQAHDGMRRKCSPLPYILHPMEAAVIIASMTSDEELLAAAMLHDVVEDAGITLVEIKEKFGLRVAELVASETEYKRVYLPAAKTWKMRKEESIAVLRETKDVAVKMLYLGDKLANLRSIYREYRLRGDEIWQEFNQRDPAQHHWYYRSIADAISELSVYDAWQEFNQLICELFEKDGV